MIPFAWASIGAIAGILIKAARDRSVTKLVGTLGGPENATKQRLFGPMEFLPDPQPKNPEAIKITNDWEKDNIVSVRIPQLNKTVEFHRKGADRLVQLFAAWESAGLMPLVMSYDGTWVPRFIRGSKTMLSNHAFGTAIDLNARWNPLGKPGAPAGETGSTQLLGPVAESLGWRWGGRFSRLDPMHFELVS